jgi:hypothetical protein
MKHLSQRCGDHHTNPQQDHLKSGLPELVGMFAVQRRDNIG